ncbi:MULTISPECIES: ferritin-like protein [Streptomyces]|uniref:Ferritin-like protein n=1 Tax=Streptomyces flaveolus TaxID=67297 RepID=A0ABV3AHP1_9ACTN|nr:MULTISPECIES: ferritin-like protein [Streptomyces]
MQQAVLLELATLPPYLCGLWSIEDPSQDEGVFHAIREIAFDEMSHLGLADNLLTTTGGVPRLADLDMYARIEEPDHPITAARATTRSA